MIKEIKIGLKEGQKGYQQEKNSRSPLKSPLRMPKKSPKISPGKNYDKAMSLGRDKSISSSNEDNDNPLRHNKNKGGKASPASGAEKQLAIGALFRKQALQQKKGSDVSKVNERPKKGDENRVTDTTMTKSDRYKSSELEDVSTKRDQSYSDFKDMGTNSSVKLRYRAKTEHPEIRRPVVLCRIPLSNLKNMSQNLSSVFELRECSVTVRPSRQLDSMASLVSPYNQPSHAEIVTEDEPKSDRSAEKTRSRSRRDSSTSSKSRRKRNRRHVSRNMNEDSSNSDHDGSVHSSSGSLHAKRRKKEPKETDIDKSAFSNKRTCLLSDEQGSLEDHTSHHVPLNAVENEERALKNNLLSAESNSIALNVHSRVNVQDEQHSNYHDAVEYYGYNENSRNASSLEEVIPTSRSSDNPMPSTSNDTQSHQSIMMPPPNKRFYSYLEHRRTEEDQIDDNEIDPSVYMNQAKTLKHDADKELDKERQAMKYLQAVLYFILFANSSEQRNEKQSAFTLYQETLSLVKHVCRPFKNSEFGNFDNKLAVISLRCQSLLFLKLYKMRRHELKECQKIIGDHIQKATSSNTSQSTAATATAAQGSNNNTSPNNVNGNGNSIISPTPSPAGSEGSVCSI